MNLSLESLERKIGELLMRQWALEQEIQRLQGEVKEVDNDE